MLLVLERGGGTEVYGGEMGGSVRCVEGAGRKGGGLLGHSSDQ